MDTDFRILDLNQSKYVFNKLESICNTVDLLTHIFTLADRSNEDLLPYYSAIREMLANQSYLIYQLTCLFNPKKDFNEAQELINLIKLNNSKIK